MDAICAESTRDALGPGAWPGLRSDPLRPPRSSRCRRRGRRDGTCPSKRPLGPPDPPQVAVPHRGGAPGAPAGPPSREGARPVRPRPPRACAHLGLQPPPQGGPRVVDHNEHVPLNRGAQRDDRFAILDLEIPEGAGRGRMRQRSCPGRRRPGAPPRDRGLTPRPPISRAAVLGDLGGRAPQEARAPHPVVLLGGGGHALVPHVDLAEGPAAAPLLVEQGHGRHGDGPHQHRLAVRRDGLLGHHVTHVLDVPAGPRGRASHGARGLATRVPCGGAPSLALPPALRVCGVQEQKWLLGQCVRRVIGPSLCRGPSPPSCPPAWAARGSRPVRAPRAAEGQDTVPSAPGPTPPTVHRLCDHPRRKGQLGTPQLARTLSLCLPSPPEQKPCARGQRPEVPPHCPGERALSTGLTATPAAGAGARAPGGRAERDLPGPPSHTAPSLPLPQALPASCSDRRTLQPSMSQKRDTGTFCGTARCPAGSASC